MLHTTFQICTSTLHDLETYIIEKILVSRPRYIHLIYWNELADKQNNPVHNYPFKVADWFLTWSLVKVRWAAVPGTWVTLG